MTEFDQLPALISVPKAAKLLGLSRASAYRFAASGDLPTRRLGGRIFVVTAKLRAFIDGDGGRAA
jgi:predicted DNA-binding transcriptional regulator AlpA